jgi:hypothetical protein
MLPGDMIKTAGSIWFMKKVLLLLSVSFLALLSACDRGPDKAAARERRPEMKPDPKIEVTRWKQTGNDGRLYGIIIEQQEGRVSANLYSLEDGEGLVIREKESQGKYFPDKKAIVFPLYSPAGVTPDKWIADGGPYILVPWEPGVTSLTGTLKDPSRSQNFVFSRLESVAATYPLPVPKPANAEAH